jgi:hypothetical protein
MLLKVFDKAHLFYYNNKAFNEKPFANVYYVFYAPLALADRATSITVLKTVQCTVLVMRDERVHTSRTSGDRTSGFFLTACEKFYGTKGCLW